MMKKLGLIFPLLLYFFSLSAQDKLPSFGKVEKADLEMKDCDFDPGSEAIVLLDIGEIEVSYVQDIGWQSVADYRVRIKILKASAIHRAEVKISYYSGNGYQELSNIKGISCNLDAGGNIAVTEMEKKTVFNKTIDKDHSEASFALPDVKIGTVFEYKYKITSKSYSFLPTWYFQQSIPVRYSSFGIIIPSYFQFTTQIIKRQEIERKEGGSQGNETWYVARNMPGLKDEPYSFGSRDYLQRIEFQLSTINAPGYYKELRTTWPKVIDELLENEDFGLAIKKNIKGASDLETELIPAKSIKDKIRIIYNYVQRNMQWNEDYDLYSDKGIKDAWDKKNGNIADINFILIRLLRDAGIEASPLLASTKDHGAINTFYPFLKQFNCVLAYVKDGDDSYVMNAADKYNPFNLIPDDVLYTNALVVKKNDGGLIVLNSNKKYTNYIFINCSTGPNGQLEGEAVLRSSGYARNIRMSTYKKGKLKSMLETNEGISIKVDSLLVNKVDDELQPLEQNIRFSGNMESSGEYLFLPFTLFTGLGKNPFISEDRVMDIDFSYPKSYSITGSYNLSDDYVVNELPKNIKMILPDTSIALTRLIQKDDNIITFSFTLDFNASGYSAESYPYIKEFFKKLYEILDERITLKKK